MDELSPVGARTDDISTTVPPPPLPMLGGGPATAPLQQQEWVGERRTFPLIFKPGRQSMGDSISEFRTGQMIFDSEGFTVTGKAVLPAHTQTTILVVLLVLFRMGALLAYFILEYAIRRDRTERLSWNEVSAVLIDPVKSQACIIYNLPNKPKTKYSLGFKLEGGYMEEFLQSIRPHLSERIIEGKIGPATPLVVWIILGVITLAIIGFIIYASVTK